MRRQCLNSGNFKMAAAARCLRSLSRPTALKVNGLQTSLDPLFASIKANFHVILQHMSSSLAKNVPQSKYI